MTDTPCLRWQPGRAQSWRRRSEGGFDADRYGAVEIPEAEARPWVLGRHYSGTYPSGRLQYGMFDLAGPGPVLCGVAVLSTPVNARALTKVFPGLVPSFESIDLGRFVLADEVPANGETWFLAEVFRLAALEGIRGVLSSSDPVPRTDVDGRTVFPGHLGIIYQAKSALHLRERGTARTHKLLPDGTVFSPRSMQKIRAQERGHEGAEQQLVRWGARPPRAGEDPAAWLRRALEDVGARNLRHPGTHRYAFRVGTTPAARRRVQVLGAGGEYPKDQGAL